MLQTSSKWDKDECHRCCKSVNSFSAPMLTAPGRNSQKKLFEYKHSSVHPRLGQFFPFWEFIFQTCKKASRAVWPLLDCNANRQSPLEFISLEVIWGKPQDATFLWDYAVPQNQFLWDKVALCKFTTLKTTHFLSYRARKKTSGYILVFITIKTTKERETYFSRLKVVFHVS